MSLDAREGRGKRPDPYARRAAAPISPRMDAVNWAGLAALILALLIVLPRVLRIRGGEALRGLALWLAIAVGLALLYSAFG